MTFEVKVEDLMLNLGLLRVYMPKMAFLVAFVKAWYEKNINLAFFHEKSDFY